MSENLIAASPAIVSLLSSHSFSSFRKQKCILTRMMIPFIESPPFLKFIIKEMAEKGNRESPGAGQGAEDGSIGGM